MSIFHSFTNIKCYIQKGCIFYSTQKRNKNICIEQNDFNIILASKQHLPKVSSVMQLTINILQLLSAICVIHWQYSPLELEMRFPFVL